MGKIRIIETKAGLLRYESYKENGDYYHVPRGEHSTGGAYDSVQSMKEDVERNFNP